MTVYDPKAIVTLEVTILCGWWAELELPPVKSMTTTDLDGLAGNDNLQATPCPYVPHRIHTNVGRQYAVSITSRTIHSKLNASVVRTVATVGQG